jgi:hypothetical protein
MPRSRGIGRSKKVRSAKNSTVGNGSGNWQSSNSRRHVNNKHTASKIHRARKRNSGEISPTKTRRCTPVPTHGPKLQVHRPRKKVYIYIYIYIFIDHTPSISIHHAFDCTSRNEGLDYIMYNRDITYQIPITTLRLISDVRIPT